MRRARAATARGRRHRERAATRATTARPNLVARLDGKNGGAPLLLYGHVDVVPTAGQQWTHPPFDAELVDGVVWGRGALDMKSGVAMMITAFVRAKVEGRVPPGGASLCARRRGARRRLRREVPRRAAARGARRREARARRGRRHPLRGGWEALLPDPGGREADVPHASDGSRPRRPRGATDARRRDGAPRAHAGALDRSARPST